jgi:uncharacterized pyridoxamine 5'-phosphate oxidase family protein
MSLTMTKDFVYDFLSRHKLAVLSTVNEHWKPESALVGIAVSENLEIIFDTANTTRKYRNILHNPNVALVIGWDDETTIQFEGTAEELTGPGADKYKEAYFRAFPDGRNRAVTWNGIVHFKVTPRWLRCSHFNEPKTIEEIVF